MKHLTIKFIIFLLTACSFSNEVNEIDKTIDYLLLGEVDSVDFEIFNTNPDSLIRILKDKKFENIEDEAILDYLKSVCYNVNNEADSSCFYLGLSIQKNPNNYFSNYDMGVLLYNLAVEKHRTTSLTYKGYLESLEKIKPSLTKASYYFNICDSLKPCDSVTMSALKEIYFTIGDSINYKRIENNLINCGYNQ